MVSTVLIVGDNISSGWKISDEERKVEETKRCVVPDSPLPILTYPQGAEYAERGWRDAKGLPLLSRISFRSFRSLGKRKEGCGRIQRRLIITPLNAFLLAHPSQMGTAVNIRETAVLCGVSFDVLHGITRGSVILHGLCSLYGESLRFSSKKRPKSIARGRMMRDYKSYEWPMNRSSGILNSNVNSWESHIINCDRTKESFACIKFNYFFL